MSTPVHSSPLGRARRRVARLLTAAVAITLAAAALPALAPLGAQVSTTTDDPAEAAATWLASQLVDGDHFEASFGEDTFPDQGLTADAVLAFAAAGAADDAAAAATQWLAQDAITAGYVGDGTAESYAGALAKLALVAQVRGLDPTSWGETPIDLIGRLEAREQGSGRFADLGEFGDFSNVLGQSLAVVVLERQTGTSASDAAVDLLLQSQCDDGGFDLDLEPVDECASGVDSTALAVQALLAADRVGDSDELVAALDHLEAAQADDGSFASIDGVSNSNSTGLAGLALTTGDRADAGAAAASYLASLQLGCEDDEAARGAVPFDDAGLDGRAARATAQAILALAPTSLAALTAAEAADARPRFDCPEPTATTSTSTSTSTTSTTVPDTEVEGLEETPTAEAVTTTPRLTG